MNIAVFHEVFRNFQLNTFNGLNFVVENVNSCSENLSGADGDNSALTGACTGKTRAGVKSQGFELEIYTRPIRNVQWNARPGVRRHALSRQSGGGRRARLDQRFVPASRPADFERSEMDRDHVSHWTPPIGGSGLRGLFYVDARYMSKYNTGSDLDIEKTQKAFGVVNGRIGLHGPDNSWGIEFWGQNLFNKKFIQVAFDAPVQGSGTTRGVQAGFYPRSTQLYGAFLGEPRTFGVTLRGKLGFSRPAPVEYTPPPAPPPPPPVVEQPAPPPPPPPPPPPTTEGERG